MTSDPAGRAEAARSWRVPLALLAACLTCGCVTPTATPAAAAAPRAGVRLYVTRPFRATPEPDQFIQGVIVALTEEVVRAGYDWGGVVLDPAGGRPALLSDLAEANAARPGTAGLHLVFVEAPTLVGFGTAYTSIRCTTYGPRAEVLRDAYVEPPERRPLVDLIYPMRQPDLEGRRFGERLWRADLAALFPPRGAPLE